MPSIPIVINLSAKVRSFLDLMTKTYRDNPDWADPCGACGKDPTNGIAR